MFSEATWVGSWPIHQACYIALTNYQAEIIAGNSYHGSHEIHPAGTDGIVWFYITDYDGMDELRAMSCIPGDGVHTKHMLDAIPLAWQVTGIPEAVR